MTDLTPRRRSICLGLCCVAVLLIGIDMTAVNVALPSIGLDFHTGASGLSWTIDAYTLTLATLLMLSASTADRVGRKRVFRIGLATFVVGSGLCAIAPGLGWLIAFRALQGIGGSMLTPVAMSIIANLYTDRGERAKAIGVWAGITGLAMALGPVVGGLLVTSSLGWRWIFVINVPIGLAALVLVGRFIPESKSPHPRRLDLAGQALVAVILATLIYGIIEGPQLGWTSPVIVTCLALAICALAGLLAYEPRHDQPLLELGFFKSVPFSGANLIAVASFAALGAFLLVNTLYLQEALHYSALHAGLLLLPLAVASVIVGPINGRLLAKHGPRPSFLIAGIALTVAGLMLTRVTDTTPLWWLFTAYAAMGIGNSAVGAPITHTAVAGMPLAQSGVAAGINSTTRQLGSTLGVAIAGATLAATDTGTTSHQLAQATHTAWWLNAAYGFVVLTLGILTTTTWARATATRALPLLPQPSSEQAVSHAASRT
jgi:EmrB/QacA subfamily drug resistance transporter